MAVGNSALKNYKLIVASQYTRNHQTIGNLRIHIAVILYLVTLIISSWSFYLSIHIVMISMGYIRHPRNPNVQPWPGEQAHTYSHEA